jgi:hypothetical protein
MEITFIAACSLICQTQFPTYRHDTYSYIKNNSSGTTVARHTSSDSIVRDSYLNVVAQQANLKSKMSR